MKKLKIHMLFIYLFFYSVFAPVCTTAEAAKSLAVLYVTVTDTVKHTAWLQRVSSSGTTGDGMLCNIQNKAAKIIYFL